jgi:recombination protein RecA
MAKKQNKSSISADEIMSKYGLKRFGETNHKVARISTGSYMLNNLISQQPLLGYTVGSIVEIFGPESSGKTTLALTAIADMQRSGKQVAMIDAETSLDPNHARACGVDMAQLLYMNPDSGEQALDAVYDIANAKLADLIVVDSVAALVPQAELEGNAGMGSHARMMSSALRKIVGILARKDVTVIFINQVRNKIGVMVGDPTTTTGGNALKFYAGARIKMRTPLKMSPSFGEIKQQNANSANPIGIWMRAHVVKNKMGIPFRSSEIPFIFETGICWPLEIYRLARSYELISRKSNNLLINNIPIGKDLDDIVPTLYQMDDANLISILKYLNSRILELNEKDTKYSNDVFRIEYEEELSGEEEID